jgi:hypothetical protein
LPRAKRGISKLLMSSGQSFGNLYISLYAGKLLLYLVLFSVTFVWRCLMLWLLCDKPVESNVTVLSSYTTLALTIWSEPKSDPPDCRNLVPDERTVLENFFRPFNELRFSLLCCLDKPSGLYTCCLRAEALSNDILLKSCSSGIVLW